MREVNVVPASSSRGRQLDTGLELDSASLCWLQESRCFCEADGCRRGDQCDHCCLLVSVARVSRVKVTFALQSRPGPSETATWSKFRPLSAL